MKIKNQIKKRYRIFLIIISLLLSATLYNLFLELTININKK